MAYRISAGDRDLEYNCEAPCKPCLIYNGGLGAEPPVGSRAEPLVRGSGGFFIRNMRPLRSYDYEPPARPGVRGVLPPALYRMFFLGPKICVPSSSYTKTTKTF